MLDLQKTEVERRRIARRVIASKSCTVPENGSQVRVDAAVVLRRYFGTSKHRGEKVRHVIETDDYIYTLKADEELNRHDARVTYAIVKLVQDKGITIQRSADPDVPHVTLTKVGEATVVIVTARKTALKNYLGLRDWSQVVTYLERMSGFEESVLHKATKDLKTTKMILKITPKEDGMVEILLDKEFIDRCAEGFQLDYQTLCLLDGHQHASALYELMEKTGRPGRYLVIDEESIMLYLWGPNPDRRTDNMQKDIMNAFAVLQDKNVISSFVPYGRGKERFWAYSHDDGTTAEDLKNMMLAE